MRSALLQRESPTVLRLQEDALHQLLVGKLDRCGPDLAQLSEGYLNRRESGSPWRDAGGLTWLDPANTQVQDYLIGLCRELAQLGFDEVVLTDCCYPTQGDLTCLAGTGDRAGTLETFCRRLQGALADYPVRLSVVGEGDSLAPNSPSGQTAALLASFPGRVWAEEENAAALAVFSPVVMPE